LVLLGILLALALLQTQVLTNGSNTRGGAGALQSAAQADQAFAV